MSEINQSVLKIAILRLLIDKSRGVSDYLLFKKLKVPMTYFVEALFELEEIGHISNKNGLIEITKAGGKAIMRGRKMELPKVSVQRIPQKMLRLSKLTIEDPYIPSISRLDSSLRFK